MYQEGIPPLKSIFFFDIHDFNEEQARRQVQSAMESQEQKDTGGWGTASAGCHQDS